MMSSSKTPCAACKLQRRKCTPECVFAPYFPPDIPQKFQNVHQVFGASNISKILTDLDVAQREEAVRSLAYEADTRITDPVYGCVGHIAYLQQKLRHLTNEIDKANKEIALYCEGNHGFQPFLVSGLDAHHAGTTGNIVYGPSSVYPYNNMPPQTMVAARGGGNLVIRDPQQQQQLAEGDIDLRQVQELYGIYDQPQQPLPPQKDFMSYGGGGSVSGSGFNQAAELSASLALNTFDNSYHVGQGGDCHQPQPNQHHHHHNLQELQHQSQRLHHQLQESSQQPQQQQLQPQPQHHHQLQKQMLLQPQPQHQEQSKDT